MAFTPLPTLGPVKNKAQLRYCIRMVQCKARLYLAVSKDLLSQVKGEPKFWRLETDVKAKRGRLTGCFQHDGNGATRKQPGYGKATSGFTWGMTPESAALFPDKGKVTALQNIEITSLGIEFDLA